MHRYLIYKKNLAILKDCAQLSRLTWKIVKNSFLFVKCYNFQIEEMERNIHNMRRRPSPKKNHRVRIHESPKKRPHTPPSKLIEA